MKSREKERLEFKEAKSSFSVLGAEKNRYSVLGYCVGLGNMRGGKLILGVSDKIPRKIVGTSALENFEDVKSKIYQQIGMHIDIQEITDHESKRIVVVTIPSRKIGTPLKFYGIPLMRIGEELMEMDEETETAIRRETAPDWSAAICDRASLADLDPTAIDVARNNF